DRRLAAGNAGPARPGRNDQPDRRGGGGVSPVARRTGRRRPSLRQGERAPGSQDGARHARGAGGKPPATWTLRANSGTGPPTLGSGASAARGSYCRSTATDREGTTRAGSRPRQQRRPGPQGAQEKDAARGDFPRDEASRPLRKAIREEGAGAGGGHPPGPQAGAQARPARRPVAGQAQAGDARPRRSGCPQRSAALNRGRRFGRPLTARPPAVRKETSPDRYGRAMTQPHAHARARFHSAAALLIAAALAACSTLTQQTTSSEEEDTAYSAGPANIASLSEVVQRNPSDPQAYNMRGTVLGRAGRYQEALADFDRAIRIDPNYAQAYANRGLIYRQTNKLAQAIADYNHALSIDANYAVAYVGRGIVYRQQGQAMEALADFNKAISIRPDNSQAYYNRGLLYQVQNQHQYAIDDFTTAVGLSHQQAEPYIARGLSYLAVKDNKAATGDLDTAVPFQPQNLPALMSRGLPH